MSGSNRFGSPNPAQSSIFGSNFSQTLPAFGSQPFVATSQPTFGSTSTQSSPSFGSTPSPLGAHSAFGVKSTTPLFGSPGFGQTPFGGQRGGTRVVPYTTTNETDSGSSVSGLTIPGKLLSISAMPQYKEKTHEELRWEDYQSGDKGTGFGCTPFGSSSSAAFNCPFRATSLSSPFGTVSLSPSLFGSSTTPAFRGASSASPFGTSSSPAFDATSFGQASQTGSLFGSTPSLRSSPAFGSSTSFGNTQSSGLFQSPTFGSPGFGQTPFGGQRGGSRVAPYTTTNETDSGSSVSGLTMPGELLSISAMPQYKEKTHEELRWEDYQSGDEGAIFVKPTQSSSFVQTTSSAFGQASTANPFPDIFSGFLGNIGTGFGCTPFGSSSSAAFNCPFRATSLSSPFGTVSSSPSLFGSSTTPAFRGASSASLCTSSSPAFDSTPFGQASQTGSLFGSTPLRSTPTFGSSTSFGSTCSSGMFQSPTFVSPGLGQTPFCGERGGSRVAPYTTTNETDGGSSVSGLMTPGELLSISAMPQYKEKSHEELRWEDYQSGGISSQPTQSSPFGPTTSSAFGQTTSAFGQASAANPFSDISPGICENIATGFGSTPFVYSSGAAFNSPFGATSLSSPFGTVSSSPSLFGSSTTLAFGGASSASNFGTSSSPAFGSTPLGQASQPGSLFGSAPLLRSSPAFGSSISFRNTQSSGLFQSPTPALGWTTTVFGQFTPAFGQTTPAFGQTTNVFGQITPAFVSNLFSNSTASMMLQSKLGALTQSMPSIFGGFQNPTPTQTQDGSVSLSNFGQPQPTGGEMEASNYQNSKVALGKQTREVEKENMESAITSIFQRMDKDKEIMEQLKEKVEQLTSYVQYLVGPIQSSAQMPTLPFVNVADKDMPPAGEIGCIVKATKSWMEDLVALGLKLIDEAFILYHKIHEELNFLADMNKKFDEELQGLEWILSQLKEMMKIDFDILVAEEIFDGSDPSLHIGWIEAAKWRMEILEEGKRKLKEVDGTAHDALVDIQDFIEKIPCDFYDDQKSINSAGVLKDQLAKVIKEESSVLDVASLDRLMKLKVLCWNFEKKLIKCRRVPPEVLNIHITQDNVFQIFRIPK